MTLFQQEVKQGSIGLIAHNYLAGADFFIIEIGDVISISEADDLFQEFVVQRVEHYQALQPNSIHSHFQNLETIGILSAHELAKLIYGQKGQLILQTCIKKDGNMEWGRLFITAELLTS